MARGVLLLIGQDRAPLLQSENPFATWAFEGTGAGVSRPARPRGIQAENGEPSMRTPMLILLNRRAVAAFVMLRNRHDIIEKERE